TGVQTCALPIFDEVVELIKGPKGSTVQLQVIKNNQSAGSPPQVVSIVRDKVKLEDRAAKLEVMSPETGPYVKRKLGVISIPSFYNGVTRDVEKIIAEAQQQDVEGDRKSTRLNSSHVK